MTEFAVFISLEQHALEFQKYGLKIEQLGKEIQQNSDQIAMKHGQLIGECGRVIRQKLEEAKFYLQVAIELTEEAQTCTQAAVKLDEYHTELITLISRLQLKARNAFI
ncbi:hypothetical protein [Chroococcidiopsis sp.]|uniref:hypothetical protein n=1 Tax=Chroococcidiopsis sp. TaxID=3088168 RepID=UPI003F2FC753